MNRKEHQEKNYINVSGARAKSQSSLQIMPERLNFTCRKKKKKSLDTDFTHSTIINSKWSTKLRSKRENR